MSLVITSLINGQIPYVARWRAWEALKSVLGWRRSTTEGHLWLASLKLVISLMVASILWEKGGFILVLCGVWQPWYLHQVWITIKKKKDKQICLCCWGRIWWSLWLLAEVEQSPSFGRIWTLWLKKTARGEGSDSIWWCLKFFAVSNS